MDTPFVYNQFVTGSDFVSRKQELNLFTNLVKQKQNVLIYEPPKSGKKSLIQQGLINLHKEGYEFTISNINLFNVRTKKHLLQKLCKTLLDSYCNAPDEKLALQQEICPEMEIYFGKSDYQSTPEIDISPVPDQIATKILNLPEYLSQRYKTNSIIYIEEFQELLQQDNAYDIIKLIENVLLSQQGVTYIITGSMVNSMKEIFEVKKYFYNFAERIKFEPLDIRSLSDLYIRNFHKTGRVVSREMASLMYQLTEGHPWYAQQMGDISYALTRGYLTEQVVKLAFHSLLELHSYRYQLITSRLSRFQINFLKAIMDNVEQLSSIESMKYYGFNSSANVKRLKDAAKRKEILTEENGQWAFLDPLFKTWLQTVYFDL